MLLSKATYKWGQLKQSKPEKKESFFFLQKKKTSIYI